MKKKLFRIKELILIAMTISATIGPAPAETLTDSIVPNGDFEEWMIPGDAEVNARKSLNMQMSILQDKRASNL